MDSSPARRVLLRGGAVYAPTSEISTAMLVVDGVIAWIGDAESAISHQDEADVIIELEGRLVTPGFVDAHVHLASTGFALESVDLGDAPDRVTALDRLAAYAKDHPGPVVYAHGWDESRWPDRRYPTRTELDRAVGDIPAYVARVDSHSAIISSALLALRPDLVTIDGWSEDGRVERDAHHAVRDVTHDLWSEHDRQSAILRALQHAASRGVTSVHELNAPHIAPFDDFRLIDKITADSLVPEVVPYWGQLFSGDDPSDAVVGYAGDLCMDGAIGSRTAAMAAPYTDADTSGHLYLDREQVRDHVVACTQSGKQAGFHVIGDRATREVTAGFEAAAEAVGRDAMIHARHRLEHTEMPSDADIDTMAALGVVASVQPAFDAAWGAQGQLYETRLGRERAEPMNPFGRMHRAGVILAFGSDSPITPIDPWSAVRAAVHHHAEGERLDVATAFDAHTRGGHRAQRDDSAGVLAVGAPATYALWEVSPAPGPSALPALHRDAVLPRCTQTVLAGTVIFDREENP